MINPFDVDIDIIKDLAKSRDIEFVSFDGNYPNYCGGTLTLKIKNEVIKLKGCLFFDDFCREGFWNIHGIEYDSERKKIKVNTSYILRENVKSLMTISKLNIADYFILIQLINDNLEYGRCGGCL